MKSRLLLTRAAASVLLLLPFAARAQSVGIGTTAPDASAALDVVSTTKGLLVPRVASVTALASPAPGLLVYQTGTPAGFYYNAGTAAAPGWQQVATAASAAAVAAFTATNGLTKTGQVVTFGGNLTSPVTILQAGNAFSLTDGNVGIGTATPQATLDTNGDFRVSNGTTGATLGTTGSAYANLNGALGQSFTMPVAGTVTSIRLVAGNNTFSTTFVLRSGAGPSGPALTTAQTINFTANASTTVALTTPVALAAGTYTIVLDAGSNQLRYFNGGENYTGGFVYVGTSG